MRGSVQCYFILSQLARFCKKNLRKFADDGGGDCDARRRSSRRKIALSRARSISRSIGATPQPRRPRRNCASSAAFHSRAAESVSCTVCRMCGGVCEYVRHAAEFMRFRCPACARRRELPARGACRAGDGVFSEFTNRITLLKQRNSGERMQIALARRLFSLPRAVLSCCAARCAVMPAAESNSVGKTT